MSASIPSVVRPTDCCATSCDDTSGSNIPGPQGPAGANGTNGTNGTNAFTTTTAGFTMPAVSGNVAVTVAVSSWASVGQVIYISNAGYFSVAAVPDATHITATNLGYTGNVAPTTVVGGSQTVSPAGIKGTDGAAGSATLNDLSPTTTKGDIIVDNGANSPAANDVRLAVGTDGQLLASVSTQPTGLQWESIIPNAATDNAVVRFNGASGTPVPVQTSLVDISDTGAITTTPGGGDPRGANAVDLQVTRAGASQVASGDNASITGGLNNTADGAAACVAGGDTNQASGDDAGIIGGAANQATGLRSAIAGGNSNAATQNDAAVLGGSGNTASGQEAAVVGGASNSCGGLRAAVIAGASSTASKDHAIAMGSQARANLFGQHAHASGQFSSQGDAQTSRLVMAGTTSDVTPTEIFLDNSGGGSERMTIPNDTTWAFRMLIVARRSDANDESAAYQLLGCIDRNATALSTALVGSVTKTVIAEDTVAWDVAATADTTNGALILTVTGENGKSIRWVCLVELSQCSG